jgi:hypothetical protein
VVIGGSVAGLCAARVLSDVFERVTVLDRDVYPDEAKEPKGVPQSRHPHVLLDGGRHQFEHLFPGFVADMLAGGALELDPGLDMAVLRPDGWAPRQATANTLLFSIEEDRWIVTTASWGGRELARDPESFDRIISKLRSPVLADAVGGDKGAEPSRVEAFVRRVATFYLGQIAFAAAKDTVVSQKLFEVINLRSHPNALIADPRILARVIWARLRQRLTPTVRSREKTPDYPPAPGFS